MNRNRRFGTAGPYPSFAVRPLAATPAVSRIEHDQGEHQLSRAQSPTGVEARLSAIEERLQELSVRLGPPSEASGAKASSPSAPARAAKPARAKKAGGGAKRGGRGKAG